VQKEKSLSGPFSIGLCHPTYLSKMGLSCMMSDIMPPTAPRPKKMNMPRESCRTHHTWQQPMAACRCFENINCFKQVHGVNLMMTG
jgi:hypothetical protein